MNRTAIRLATISFLFFGSASYAGEWCNSVSEGSPKTTDGPVRLYVSQEYKSDYYGINQIVGMGGGISCSHTKPAAKEQLLTCSNGIMVLGKERKRLCTRREEEVTAAIYELFGIRGECTRDTLDWVLRDKQGQTFLSLREEWVSVSPVKGCVLSSSRKYEERGYKALQLKAGDSYLYFVRDQLSVYSPKRQPAL